MARNPPARATLQLNDDVARRAEALDAVLPFDRRTQLAAELSDDDIATLRHLAGEGLGANSRRALAAAARFRHCASNSW